MKNKCLISILALLLSLTQGRLAAAVPQMNYAQRLVNMVTFRNPDLLVMGMHVTAPGAKDNTVIAANVDHLIGEKSDDDDLKAAQLNKAIFMKTPDQARCEVMLPLRDVKDQTIGTLVFAFRYVDDPRTEGRCIERATTLRNQLQELIPSAKDLFDVYNLASEPTDILAQRLTIAAAQRHPEMLVLAMHLKASGDKSYKIWATNRPLIMGTVETDNGDPEVGEGGQTILRYFRNTHRMFLHMPLRAKDGTVCGGFVVLTLWFDENDLPGFVAKAMSVRDELQNQISDYASLFRP